MDNKYLLKPTAFIDTEIMTITRFSKRLLVVEFLRRRS
jgi:DNA polymerase sigma